MKNKLRPISRTLLCTSFLFYLTACNTTPPKENQVKVPEVKATAPAVSDTIQLKAYVCPMGPECGQSDTAGKCPSCGMDMKANPKIKK
ncbi:MAG: heavy metal-binding domain-containing protein [Bacteroidia bacterium]